MPTLTRVLIAIVAAGACGQERHQVPTTTPQPSNASAPEGTVQPMRDGPQAPVTITVEPTRGSPSPGATIELRARIRSVASWRLPISVEVKLPTGATLIAGDQRVTLQPTARRTEEAVEFSIRLRDVPTDDLIVVADSQSSDGGVHAEAHYRFGRQEPQPVVPVRSGPEVKTSKANFGRAVPIRTVSGSTTGKTLRAQE